jgi:hypothetical protein
MHYHVETNALICLIKRLPETFGGFSLHQLSPETVTLLLESSLVNTDTSLTRLHFTSTYSELAVTTHHQLINQEAIYTSSCVAVHLNFKVFQRTHDSPLGQHIPHSTFPTHHRLWDTTNKILDAVVYKRLALS